MKITSFRMPHRCFLILTALALGGCVTESTLRDPATAAEARAVEFLKREVPAWSRENGCFSCHNNGDAARALYAATRRGHRVPAAALTDTTAWVAQPRLWEHNKGDPGFSDKRLANIQFAASLLAAFDAGRVKDRRPLLDAARKIAADQGEDGAWPIELQNAVGSPATYGTTLATYMALRILQQANAPGTSEAIRKAEDWLRRAAPNNVPTAATLLLASELENVREHSKPLPLPAVRGESAGKRAGLNPDSISKGEECLNLIRSAQTRDGGWGPYIDSPPEPFDTAIVVLALAEWRDTPGVGELIQGGRRFLVAQQRPDGSWPATTRPSGGVSYAQRLSTTGWATLALLATQE